MRLVPNSSDQSICPDDLIYKYDYMESLLTYRTRKGEESVVEDRRIIKLAYREASNAIEEYLKFEKAAKKKASAASSSRRHYSAKTGISVPESTYYLHQCLVMEHCRIANSLSKMGGFFFRRRVSLDFTNIRKYEINQRHILLHGSLFMYSRATCDVDDVSFSKAMGQWAKANSSVAYLYDEKGFLQDIYHDFGSGNVPSELLDRKVLMGLAIERDALLGLAKYKVIDTYGSLFNPIHISVPDSVKGSILVIGY